MAFLKFQADSIFTGTEMLGSTSILIADEKGIIKDIIDEKDAGDNVQKFSGIMSPGFINCHCHLELSHLKGLIPERTGMVDFVLNIMQKRASTEELIQDAIEKAEAEMIANGIVAVGDICNTINTINQKKKGKIHYHNFIEVSGFVPDYAQQRFDTGKEIYSKFIKDFPNTTTLVPHAPYSVSSNLFELISNFSQGKISTIHNQESQEENEFFEQKSGDFERLYKVLGIDISFFKAHQKSSLASIGKYLTKDKKTILVHNTFTSINDIQTLNSLAKKAKTQFYYCICVLANTYITNSFPNEALFETNLSNIVLGTDSLASNHTLNLFNEIEFMKNKFLSLSYIDLLRFATYNGASALGIENRYGSFKKGKQPGIILIDRYLKSSQSLISN